MRAMTQVSGHEGSTVLPGTKLGDAFTQFVINDQAVKKRWAQRNKAFRDLKITDLLGRCPVSLNADDLMRTLWNRCGLKLMYKSTKSSKAPETLIRAAIDVLVRRYKEFFDQIRGPQPKLIANGTTADGLHVEIDAAQWDRSDRFVEFGTGDVWARMADGRLSLLWSGVTLAERRQSVPLSASGSGPLRTPDVQRKNKARRPRPAYEETVCELTRLGLADGPRGRTFVDIARELVGNKLTGNTLESEVERKRGRIRRFYNKRVI
jgi:hypothetical protein